jgi:hypothetical protein
MARTRRAGRRIKKGGVSEWYANMTKRASELADATAKATKNHAQDSHEKAKIAVAATSKKTAAAAKEAHAAAAVHADKLQKHAVATAKEAHAVAGKHVTAGVAAAAPDLAKMKVAAKSGVGTAKTHFSAAKASAAPHFKKANVAASRMGMQAKANLAAAHTAARLTPSVIMKGGLRRRSTTLRYKKKKKHPKKGMKSRTHKGRKDFTTKKTSKVFHRRKHYQRKSAKGVKRRPFRKCKCIC